MEGLKLQRVTVDVGENTLVHTVDVTINSGEVLGIIGPNGAGKTTLLKAISCEIEPTSGSISIAGQPLRQVDARRRACQLAILPQFSSLSFPFTVEEVVQLSRIPHRSGRRYDRQIVEEALLAMDILHLQKRLYTHLSGGEKQRVQLARTMAQIWRSEDTPGARLLLLDEPTSALDLGHQQQLMNTIKNFARQGVIVIMALHDINLVAHYADRVLALSHGHTIACGQPRNVINAAIIKQLYAVEGEVINHPKSHRPVFLGV